jgi:hypothetical protein
MRDVVIALVKSGFVSGCSSPLTTIPPGASGAAFPALLTLPWVAGWVQR